MATFVVKCTSQQLMCSYLAWIACVCAYRKIVCKKMLSFFRAILVMFNQNFYTKIYAQASFKKIKNDSEQCQKYVEGYVFSLSTLLPYLFTR